MYTQHPYKIIAHFDSYQNKLLSCMGVEYTQPAHLLDRYIKGGDINGGRLYQPYTNHAQTLDLKVVTWLLQPAHNLTT